MKYILPSATLAFLFTYSFGVSAFASECGPGQELYFGECYDVITAADETTEGVYLNTAPATTDAADTLTTTTMATTEEEPAMASDTTDANTMNEKSVMPMYVPLTEDKEGNMVYQYLPPSGTVDYSMENTYRPGSVRFRGTSRPALRTGALYTVGMDTAMPTGVSLDDEGYRNYKLAMREKYMNDAQTDAIIETAEAVFGEEAPVLGDPVMRASMPLPKILPSTGANMAAMGALLVGVGLYFFRRRQVY